MALPVQKQEALRHIFSQGGKLRLLLLKLTHLLLDGVVLPLDPGEEGGQLVIGIAVLRMLQIQLHNRLDDPSGLLGGQHSRQQQGQDQDHQNGLHHGQQQQPYCPLTAGQADHCAV